jgi:hypothetical protein
MMSQIVATCAITFSANIITTLNMRCQLGIMTDPYTLLILTLISTSLPVYETRPCNLTGQQVTDLRGDLTVTKVLGSGEWAGLTPQL